MAEESDILNAEIENEEIVEVEQSDDTAHLMEKPFDPTKINIETKTPSLDTLIKRIQRNSVAMNTKNYFQRSDDLWKPEQQSRLIESILIRFPLPAFFFDASDDNNWLIVDGLQRLSSIRNFCVDKTLKLTNLEFLTKLEGEGWDDLPANLQREIEETAVVIYKILPGTPTDVKFNIFKRINTGGLVLEDQEIRHALFQGKPAEFVARLAHSDEFKKATEYKIPSNRMLDRYFANRFLCFYLLDLDKYQSDLNTYMSGGMAKIAKLTTAELDKTEIDFKKSMKLATLIFGREAFRKVREDTERLPPINKALFDAISVQFAKLTPEEGNKLLVNKNKFKKAIKRELSEYGEFFTSVTSGTDAKTRVLFRHKKTRELIKKNLD